MLHPGIVLQNRYTVIRMLNIGGTAAVYEATDRHLKIAVALKELELSDHRLQHVLAQEAHILARLRHPALPVVFDSFVERERLFLVMQLIPGPDLAALLVQHRMPFHLDQVLRWADQLLDALIYLHWQHPPIIHRDIKPHNLKLSDEGNIMLLDFGLAKGATAAGDNGVAIAPSIVGYTLHYAPLEQIQGEGTDERSDLFALGATLYELVTGIRPPDALQRATALLSGRTDPLIIAHMRHPQVPTAVAEVLHSALSLTSHARPPSAALFRQMLSEAAGQPLRFQSIRLEERTQDAVSDFATTAPVTMVAPSSRSLPAGTITFLYVTVATHEVLHDERQIESSGGDPIDATIASVTKLGGAVFKATDRAVYAAFADATDALAAALRVQHALDEYAATGAIALHSGMAEERDGIYFGAVVDRTERLLEACHSGQIVLSRAVEELVCDHLPPDVALRDLGAHRLRGLPRPVHIFQVVSPSALADFPPLATLDQRIGNVPLPRDPLIGREREVTAVCMLLRHPEVRLITLTGPGGTGKTRLSLEVTAELADHFADGVCFVPLASVQDATLVVSAIAQALGMQEMGNQSLEESLKTYLQPKQMLLLLDNFEQIIAAAPVVDSFLTAAPDLRILTTSREPLRLASERTFPVPPLAVPSTARFSNGQARDTVMSLAQYGAVALFVARAHAARPDFVLTPDTVEAVAAICQRLDGLPLAIELAAARIRLFGPSALLARLNGAYHDTSLHLLTGGDQDRPARQQTLRQAIAWSYELLDVTEQALFRQLAVFVGGFTLEAAEMVVQEPPQDAKHTTLDQLVSLIDKSLLRREDQPDGEPRFMLLETIREYGLEQLAATNELEAVNQRHAAYCLELTERGEPELRGPNQVLWLDRLDREHANMRAALGWASANGVAALALRLSMALEPFWRTRSHAQEGSRWLQAALALTEEPNFTTLRADALFRLGSLTEIQGDYGRARTILTESLRLYRDLEDTSGCAWALHRLGKVTTSRTTNEIPRAYYAESLELFLRLGDAVGRAEVLNDVGRLMALEGNYAQAQTFIEESLALREELQDYQGYAWTLYELGHLLCTSGQELSIAGGYLQRSLLSFQQLGDIRGIAWARLYLGAIAMYCHEYAPAQHAFETSLKLFRELNNVSVGWALQYLGRLAYKQGDYRQARSYYQQSLAVHQHNRNSVAVAYVLVWYAGLVTTQGDARRAVMLYGFAEATRRSLNAPLTPWACAEYEQEVASARAQLDHTDFNTLWALGGAMRMEEAVVYTQEET